MEEQALYRAILDAPHDDTPRLVYADWLDENADRLPEPLARRERARAEFIRLQCKLSRSTPGGWKAARPPDATVPAAEAKREKRLLFTQGPKWRRELPVWLSTLPFDRGFVRPFRALRPQEFLVARNSAFWELRALHLLKPDHPSRRYLIGENAFSLCPLWDIHLFGSEWEDDPDADRGQYAELLAEVGRSPAMERVGWLKVSFFRTPTTEFLRTGNFPNVETLVLNCGPFPEVLEAVAANESFRSLRYVRFGPDRWAWDRRGDRPSDLRFASLMVRLEDANIRHLPYGEMRTVLRKIVADPSAMSLPEPDPPTPPPVAVPAPSVRSFQSSTQGNTSTAGFTGCSLLLMLLLVAVFIQNVAHLKTPTQTISVPDFRVPDLKPIDPEVFKAVNRLNLQPVNREPQVKFNVQPRPDPGFVGPPWPPPGKK